MKKGNWTFYKIPLLKFHLLINHQMLILIMIEVMSGQVFKCIKMHVYFGSRGLQTLNMPIHILLWCCIRTCAWGHTTTFPGCMFSPSLDNWVGVMFHILNYFKVTALRSYLPVTVHRTMTLNHLRILNGIQVAKCQSKHLSVSLKK